MVKIFCHVSGATPDPFLTHHRFYTYAHTWYIFGAAETNEDTHGWQHLEHFKLLEENVQSKFCCLDIYVRMWYGSDFKFDKAQGCLHIVVFETELKNYICVNYMIP